MRKWKNRRSDVPCDDISGVGKVRRRAMKEKDDSALISIKAYWLSCPFLSFPLLLFLSPSLSYTHTHTHTHT